MKHLEKFTVVQVQIGTETEQFQFIDVAERLNSAHQLWTDGIAVDAIEFRFLPTQKTLLFAELVTLSSVSKLLLRVDTYREVERFQKAIGR